MIWLALYAAFAAVVAKWLRHRGRLFQRLNDLHWQALVLVDIVAAFVIFWPLYLFGLIAERPAPGQTISAMAGGWALQGRGWAIKASVAIDALFFVLTGQRDHCLKAHARWADPLNRMG